jgi:hypothetical protein
MKNLGLNKGLENLGKLRQKLVAIPDRFAGFEAQSMNVHLDFPLFHRLALPAAQVARLTIAGSLVTTATTTPSLAGIDNTALRWHVRCDPLGIDAAGRAG